MRRNNLEVLIAHLDEAGFELVEMREEKNEEPYRHQKTENIELLIAKKRKEK